MCYESNVVTAADMRRLASVIADTAEGSHFRTPDFRIGGKIFAGLSEDERVGYAKLTSELQLGLMSARPEVFFPATGAWGHKGWTHFHLSRLKEGELKELLLEAVRLIGAKKRVAQAPGGGRAAAVRPRRRHAHGGWLQLTVDWSER
jgi:hypothetical protein